MRPGVLRDLVKSMSADGLEDVEQGLHRFLTDLQRSSEWRALLKPLSPLDRAVLQALAGGLQPMAAQTLAEVGKAVGERPTIGKVRAAIERLRKSGLVHRDPSRSPTVDDPLLAEFLRGKQFGRVLR